MTGGFIMQKHLSTKDRLIIGLENGLRTMFGAQTPGRQSPGMAGDLPPSSLGVAERRLSGSLMRVNHVGEVCAQALYQSQSLVTRDERLRNHFQAAASEELDHLAWTRDRLAQLNSHVSLLTPLWWGGAFAFGTLAGLAGDRISLGFVVETERQVEQHLAQHLTRLPERDIASRRIVAQMKADEARHADEAQAAGAAELPVPVKLLMRAAAKVMTVTAHRF